MVRFLCLAQVLRTTQHIKTMKNILFGFISKYVPLTEDEKNKILS